VTPRRVNRRHRWSLEQLEDRTLLTSSPGGDIGDAIVLNTPSDMKTGSVAPGFPVFFEIDPSADTLLVARVQSGGGYTRLSLLDSLGRLLVQSDGQSATNPDDLIEQHIPAGRDYLEVQSLGGAGTFVLSSDLAPASEPYQPINEGLVGPNLFGDFNGDGLPDLAGEAGVQLNLGDGTFGPDIPLPVPVDSFSVGGLVTDGYFDGTGRLDLAVVIGDFFADQPIVVEALLNNGDGTFQTAPTSVTLAPAFNLVHSIITGNFEGHALSDLVISLDEYPATSLAVLPSDGNGGFLAPMYYSLGDFSPYGNPVAADFSGRGLDDIAAAGVDAKNRNVIDILVNDGNGEFSPPTQIDLGGGQVDDLVAGDFSGEGRDDLAAVLTDSDGNSSVQVFQSRGDGTFQAEQPVSLVHLNANSGIASVVDDFTLDGREDIAVAGVNSSGVETADVLLNQGDGSFKLAAPIDLGDDIPFYVGAGDFDADGRPDLVVSGTNATATTDSVTVFPGNGDGSFRAATISELTPIVDRSYVDTNGLNVEGDFNGDGRPDIAVLGVSSVQVLLGAGNGTFRALPPIDVVGFGRFFVSGDFNGDGHLDLAIGENMTPTENKLVLLLGNGDGTFAAPILINLGDFTPSNAVVGDFTGDGLDDLLIEGVNPSYQTSYELLTGDRNGTFGEPVPITLAGAVPGGFDQIATGDFTGTGHDELAVVGNDIPAFPGNGSTQELAALILQINQDGTTTEIASADLGPLELNLIAVGDFRSRGRSSLAVDAENYFSSYLEELSFNADGTSKVSNLTNIGTNNPTSLAVADFNGELLDDLAVGEVAYDGSGNCNILVAEGSSDGSLQVGATIGVGTQIPFGLLAADFTGDGRPDLAFTLGYGGQTIDLLRGNGDGTFGNSQAVEPVPINNGSVQSAGGPFVAGDFNSDGRLDVAVGG